MNNPTSPNYSTVVVGGQFRQGVNWSKVRRGSPVKVVSDPLGSYTKTKHSDPNALAVYVEQGGDLVQIGYFPKDVANLLGPHVAAGTVDLQGVVSWVNGPSNLHVDYSLVAPEVDETTK